MRAVEPGSYLGRAVCLGTGLGPEVPEHVSCGG